MMNEYDDTYYCCGRLRRIIIYRSDVLYVIVIFIIDQTLNYIDLTGCVDAYIINILYIFYSHTIFSYR